MGGKGWDGMQDTVEERSVMTIRAGWRLACPVCGHRERIDGGIEGCPVCNAAGRTSALLVDYGDLAPYSGPAPRGVGIWTNWGEWLPAAPPEHCLTLGEGN